MSSSSNSRNTQYRVLGFRDDDKCRPPTTQILRDGARLPNSNDPYSDQGFLGQQDRRQGQNSTTVRRFDIKSKEYMYNHKQEVCKNSHAIDQIFEGRGKFIQGKTVLVISPCLAMNARKMDEWNELGVCKSMIFIECSEMLAKTYHKVDSFGFPTATLVADLTLENSRAWILRELQEAHQNDPNIPTHFDMLICFDFLGGPDRGMSVVQWLTKHLLKPTGYFLFNFIMTKKVEAFLCAPKDYKRILLDAVIPYCEANGDLSRINCDQHTKNCLMLDFTKNSVSDLGVALDVNKTYKDHFQRFKDSVTTKTGMVCRKSVANPTKGLFATSDTQIFAYNQDGSRLDDDDEENTAQLGRLYEAGLIDSTRGGPRQEVKEADPAYRRGVEFRAIEWRPCVLYQKPA
jgi:hypothetical protein